MNSRPLFAIALALSLGCQLQPVPTGTPTGTATRSPRPKPSALPSIKATDVRNAPIPLSEPQRVVESGTTLTELAGQVRLVSKVKIISDNGASVLSNNGGSIISNNGGTIISDNGASVVSNGGGNLIGKVKYDLLQAGGTSALAEVLLADAQIEVLDATGQLLVTPDKQPITAKTDATGRYTFKAALPPENLVLRIRLFNGGQLFAFATKDQRTGTLDIDTSSSLGAAYVLDKYVKKTQAVLNLLPGLEAAQLRTDMEKARALMGEEPLAYRPEELVAAVDQLRSQAPALDATIERIEALLVAGQKDLGSGLQATKVALASPNGVVSDGKGTFYVSESTAGRIRKIAPDGSVSVYAGPGAAAGRDGSLGVVQTIALGPDGTLYATRKHLNQVMRIPPTGALSAIAGKGTGSSAAGANALDARFLALGQMSFNPAGQLHVVENRKRWLTFDAAGLIQEVALPSGAEVSAGAFAPDGTAWLADFEKSQALYRKPSGGEWTKVVTVDPAMIKVSESFYLQPRPDGSVVVSSEQAQRLFQVTPAGVLSPIAGTGDAGYAGDDGPALSARLNTPSGMWLAADGTLYLADAGNGLVRAIAPDGKIKTVAGTRAVTQVGDALTISMSQPGGVALDDQGRIYVTEASSHSVKRLADGTLTVIAGSVRGFSGDGGQATAATMQGPTGLTLHQGAIYVADAGNERIRKIDTNGVITTVVGGSATKTLQARMPALETNLYQPLAVIVGPDGCLYWTENWYNRNVVRRLKDGFVEIVAGTIDALGKDGGDGGPATSAFLHTPSGLAFDKEGNLYVADMGNLKIRKIDKAGLITTFAGIPIAAGLAQLGAPNAKETLPTANNTAATETILWGPAGLTFDDKGNLLFSELGPSNFSAFGLSDLSMFEGLLPTMSGRIRKVTPDGKVVSVTGPGTTLLAAGTGDEMLVYPFGLYFDARERRLIVADAALNQLKVLKGGF